MDSLDHGINSNNNGNHDPFVNYLECTIHDAQNNDNKSHAFESRFDTDRSKSNDDRMRS